MITVKPYLYGGIISRFIGLPSLVSAVSGLGSLFVHENFKSKIIRLLLFPLFKLAFSHSNQKVIIQNTDDEKLLTQWGVLNPNKVILIKGSGVKINKFNNLKEVKGLPVICFASRLIVDKGVNEFVAAANFLKKKGIKARFLLAGDLDIKNPSGLNNNDLEKIKRGGSVEILGFQKNIPELFSRSHIICLPSYREGFPKVLMEAAAAGRAVITTDVPGCREAIIPNKTGLMVPVKNYKALAMAIEELIFDSQKRIEMGKEGRKFAKKNFNIEKNINKHMQVYKLLYNKNLS